MGCDTKTITKEMTAIATGTNVNIFLFLRFTIKAIIPKRKATNANTPEALLIKRIQDVANTITPKTKAKISKTFLSSFCDFISLYSLIVY